jgi:hypothetical protein
MRSERLKNREDAVSMVWTAMSSNQKDELRQIRAENLINEHFGFGLWVRNLLGPWVPPTDGEKYPPHPDDISGEIIKIIWMKLQE